jgi:hypothetical protein
MVPYKTEGSFCLLVHDDIATSSAWHAKGSGSLALERRFPGLQIRGSTLSCRAGRIGHENEISVNGDMYI